MIYFLKSINGQKLVEIVSLNKILCSFLFSRRVAVDCFFFLKWDFQCD